MINALTLLGFLPESLPTSIMGAHEATDGTWFEVYFHGAALWEGKVRKGDFRLIVKGARLGYICQEMVNGLKLSLLHGADSVYGEQRSEVTSIDIEPLHAEPLER